MDEKLIAHHMRTLHCSREDAIQLIADDRETDKGIAHDWDLTKEQRANVRKITRGTSTAPRKKSERVREPNIAKQTLISMLAQALLDFEITPTVSNTERAIDFSFQGVNYTFTLTAHRAKKEGC